MSWLCFFVEIFSTSLMKSYCMKLPLDREVRYASDSVDLQVKSKMADLCLKVVEYGRDVKGCWAL